MDEMLRTFPASAPVSATAPLPSATVHLVGIAGSGMKALAEWIVGAGYRVTGSDSSLTPDLQFHFGSLGIRTTAGHAAEHVGGDVTLLVHSPAVPAGNPERRAAQERQIPELSYPQALASIMRQGTGVSIAGTHGKSSTTGLVGSILEAAGRNPSVLCGAEILGRHRNGWGGTGPVVVESCEYRRHFLELNPQVAVVLNLEPDHFDCFPTLDEACAAYREFAARIPASGTLVLNRECPQAESLAKVARAKISWFSLDDHSAGWSAEDIHRCGEATAFTLLHHGAEMGQVVWRLAGRHQIANAIAAAAVADALDVPTDAIRAGLEHFRGLRRRLEVVGDVGGVTVIDDYAHHPTAVRATLQAVREQYGDRRIWCAFQPHQLSRTEALFEEFAEAFDESDEVLIAPIFGSRETAGEHHVRVAQGLADRVRMRGVPARFVPTLDHISMAIETDARPGDLFLVVGAGNIDRVAHDCSRRLFRNHAA